ncbi:MAG TPA: methyltransferase domain-containing protein [Bacteroidales bacterium]|nr:methyltransferase domain-containing protein [Bacteroidales bacterium]
MDFKEIDKRYSSLAEETCCLSCGGALNYTNVKEGEICIDLGSGRGTDALRLAEKTGDKGFIYGVDISEGMIRKSSETAKKLGLSNISFISSTLEDIHLESEIADLVISNCTINHSTDKQKVWNEIFRIMKKTGRFVISDIYSIDVVPLEYSNDPSAVAECWAGAVTKSEYINHIETAGFKDFRIIEESKPYEKGKIKVRSWTITATKPSLENMN